MRYNYWTVRYVPDSVREEFVNIGLIVGADGQDWANRWRSDLRAVKRLGGNLGDVTSWMHNFAPWLEERGSGAMISGATWAEIEGISSHRLAHLARISNNLFQLSAARPAIGATARDVLDMLAPNLIDAPEHETRHRPTTVMRHSLSEHFEKIVRVQQAMIERPKIETGRLRSPFDFGFGRGGVRQLTRVVSFRQANAETAMTSLQAWCLGISRLRSDGALLERPGRAPLDVVADVPVAVVHDQPSTDAQFENWETSCELWERLGVEVYGSAEAEQAKLAERVDSLV